MTDARTSHLAAMDSTSSRCCGLDDGEHPLLRLRRHHLEGRHARLPLRHLGHVHVEAAAGLRRRLRRGAGDAGGAEVLHADGEVAVEQLEAGLDQALLLERVADLDAGPLGGVVGLLAEAGRRQHRRPADAVAPGRRAQQHGQVADARGAGEHEPLGGQRAEAEHVDERVVGVGLVEDELAADGRHADGVAVAGDARHDALGDPAAAGVVEGSEPQRVHRGDGPGAHREDVAEDAADAGGRALVGLDGRRVVVALDADGGGDAVADVDDAGALAGPDEHVGRLRRQPAEVDATRLVAAVLRPHHREHRQLEVVRFSTQDPTDVVELVIGQAQVRGGHSFASRVSPCRSR